MAEEVLLTHFVNIKEGCHFFRETPASQQHAKVIRLTSFAQMDQLAVYICVDKNIEYLRVSRLDDSTVLINGTAFPFQPADTENPDVSMAVDNESNGESDSEPYPAGDDENHDGDDEEEDSGDDADWGPDDEGQQQQQPQPRSRTNPWTDPLGAHLLFPRMVQQQQLPDPTWRTASFRSAASSTTATTSTTGREQSARIGKRRPHSLSPTEDRMVTEDFLRDLAKKTKLT